MAKTISDKTVHRGMGLMRRFEDLPIHHQKAIMMKYEGFRYSEIAVEIDKSESTLQQYFWKGGYLYHDYINYERERSEETRNRFAIIHRELQSTALDAYRILKAILSGDVTYTRIQYEAALEILDRTVGKIQNNNKPNQTIIDESEYVEDDLSNLSDEELELLSRITEKLANSTTANKRETEAQIQE